MSKIHPTAIVDADAQLAEDVELGAYSIVEADVRIGAGTVLRPHAVVRRHTSLGAGNFVDSFAVLGGDPQDLKFDPNTKSCLRIGDRNTFREGVTISRAMGDGNATVVSNDTYWMTCSHAGHNAVVGDRVIVTNCTALAGHTEVGSRTVVSSCVGIHQFCWVGEIAIIQSNATITQHVPPYVLVGMPHAVIGLNAVGLKRAEHITAEDRRQIKEAFTLVYRGHLPRREALAKMDACKDWGDAAVKFREFVRRVYTAEGRHKRGLCPPKAQQEQAM